MIILAVIMNIILIAADQITKYLAVTYLRPVGSVTVIEEVFNLTFVENTGAAFGIFKGGRWFFIVVTAFLLVGIYIYYMKLPRTKDYDKVRVVINLISAGALGNFIDRLRQGYVVDFFHASFINFPVFNIADCCVVIGTSLLAVFIIFL